MLFSFAAAALSISYWFLHRLPIYARVHARTPLMRSRQCCVSLWTYVGWWAYITQPISAEVNAAAALCVCARACVRVCEGEESVNTVHCWLAVSLQMTGRLNVFIRTCLSTDVPSVLLTHSWCPSLLCRITCARLSQLTAPAGRLCRWLIAASGGHACLCRASRWLHL